MRTTSSPCKTAPSPVKKGIKEGVHSQRTLGQKSTGTQNPSLNGMQGKLLINNPLAKDKTCDTEGTLTEEKHSPAPKDEVPPSTVEYL